MQQVTQGDINVNASQWTVLFDGSDPQSFVTRNAAMDESQGSMYSCPGVDPSLSCLQPSDPESCAVCIDSSATGLIQFG
jgi:hypothetical protein